MAALPQVAPLVSYAGEGLEEVAGGRVFEDAYDLDLQGYAPQPDKRLVLPSPAVLAPFALAWLGVAAARILARK